MLYSGRGDGKLDAKSALQTEIRESKFGWRGRIASSSVKVVGSNRKIPWDGRVLSTSRGGVPLLGMER